MKLIVAVVRPERLDAVKEALADVEVFRLTVADVQALVRGQGERDAPRLEPRARLEIAVNESFVEPTLTAIVRGGRVAGGGSDPSDGSIFVLPLTDVVRIRTGERGPEAI
jgi:nitrogen regulatory protein P-II 1